MQLELCMHRSNTYMYVSKDRWGVGVGGKENIYPPTTSFHPLAEEKLMRQS